MCVSVRQLVIHVWVHATYMYMYMYMYLPYNHVCKHLCVCTCVHSVHLLCVYTSVHAVYNGPIHVYYVQMYMYVCASVLTPNTLFSQKLLAIPSKPWDSNSPPIWSLQAKWFCTSRWGKERGRRREKEGEKEGEGGKEREREGEREGERRRERGNLRYFVLGN